MNQILEGLQDNLLKPSFEASFNGIVQIPIAGSSNIFGALEFALGPMKVAGAVASVCERSSVCVRILRSRYCRCGTCATGPSVGCGGGPFGDLVLWLTDWPALAGAAAARAGGSIGYWWWLL